MSSKLVGIVTIVLLAVALAGVTLRVLSNDSNSSTLSSLFPIDQGIVDHVVITSGGSEAQLFKIGDGWRIQTYPAFQPKIDALMNSVTMLEYAQLVAQQPSSHSALGVNVEAGTKVSFMTGDEVLEKLIIGEWVPESGLSYLRRPAENLVYSLPFNLPAIYEAVADSWRDPIIINLPMGLVRELSVQLDGERTGIYLGEEGWLAIDDGEPRFVESQRVFEILSLFNPLVAIGFPSEHEASSVNIGSPDAMVTLTTFDGDQFDVAFVRRDEESHYLKAGQSITIFLVDATILQTLVGQLIQDRTPIGN